jgi:uncharacterized protein involved in exopolysaccharide biosynthesis
VVPKLKLSDNPCGEQEFLEGTGGRGNIEDWFADLLLDKLDVVPTRDSSVIAIRYTSQDPQFAVIIADTFAKAYIDTSLELRVAPARDTAVWFDEQIKTLRENLGGAQAALSAYQREKGFSATDERLDVESSRLSELSAQMVNAQAAASDATSRLSQLNDFLARGADPANLPDILQPIGTEHEGAIHPERSAAGCAFLNWGESPELQKLRADIATQRQKIKDEIGTSPQA